MARKTPNKKPTGNPIFENYYFQPKRQAQAEAAMDYEDGLNLILSGYAGTGKTYLAIALATKALMQGEIKHIHIVRSAVSSRDIGHLPGDEQKKLEVYERAIKLLFNKLLRRGDAYDVLKLGGYVSFGSTSFERGVTYENTCIIVDEFQNLTFKELDTMVTRLSDSSKIIFSGDTRQSDLRDTQSGFKRFVRIMETEGMSKFYAHHSFGIEDIVRGEMVKAWIIAAEDDEIKNNQT